MHKSAKIHEESFPTFMNDILKSLTPAQRYALSKDTNVLPIDRMRVPTAPIARDPSLGTSRTAPSWEPPVVPVRRVEAPHKVFVPQESKHTYPASKPLDQTAKEYYKR